MKTVKEWIRVCMLGLLACKHQKPVLANLNMNLLGRDQVVKNLAMRLSD